jgi:hypothetical protein
MTSRSSLRIGCWNVAFALYALCASAQSPSDSAPPTTPVAAPAPLPPGAGPVLLSATVSGGASLGAYHSGYLYYLLSTLRQSPEVADVRALTGASSGGIDAFIGALASCGVGLSANPTESHFYRLWHDTDLSKLYRPEEVTGVAMFSREAFGPQTEALHRLWNAGLPSSCDVLLGVTATRVGTHEMLLGDGSVRLPKNEFKFALRIQGQGPGKLPVVTNYVDSHHRLPQALLALGPDPRTHFDRISEVLYASAAFPIAFAPVELAYCMTDAYSPTLLDCDRASAQRALFVDGGIMDLQPLRLASTLLRSGLERKASGELSVRQRPDRTLQGVPPRTLFVYVDSDSVDYPMRALANQSPVPDDAFGLMGQLFGEFVATSRAKEHMVLLEEEPEVAQAVRVARSYYPTIGGHLMKFFGFVDEGFRDFDFYLGMYSARRDLEQRVDLGLPEGWRNGERARIEGPDDQPSVGFEKLACMRAYFDDRPELAHHCAGEAMANFRILVQVALDRIYTHCQRLRDPGIAAPTTTHAHCLAALAGKSPPQVAGVHYAGPGSAPAEPDEADFDHTLRLLGGYGYRFDGLGLSASESMNVRRALRDRFDEVLQRFAAAQPSHGLYVKLATHFLVQYLAYVPRAHELRVLLGHGLELGYSFRVPALGWEWLRPAVMLQFDGVNSLLSSRANYFTFLPQLGFEVEPIGLNSVQTQLRFGFRGGYLLASSNGVNACPPTDVRGSAPCSSYMLGGYVSLTLFELLRVQLNGDVYPDAAGEAGTAWSITPALGAEFWPF